MAGRKTEFSEKQGEKEVMPAAQEKSPLVCLGEETRSQNSVPYFCQWESPELVSRIVTGKISPADDPMWASSGASTREEYAEWSRHACGMACLKMVLAALTGKVIPTLELLWRGLDHGTYIKKDGQIHGLVYDPFVKYVREHFGIVAEKITGLPVRGIPDIMTTSNFFMASVHPWIRWPERTPPRKGGHLVLVTAATKDEIMFHDPAGHDKRSQANVTIPLRTFDKFFAERGIVIHREPKGPL